MRPLHRLNYVVHRKYHVGVHLWDIITCHNVDDGNIICLPGLFFYRFVWTDRVVSCGVYLCSNISRMCVQLNYHVQMWNGM